LNALGLRAPNTRNTLSYRGFPLEHVVGYCYHPSYDLHFTFDGTGDQILGAGYGIQVCFATTFEESVALKNARLGIAITQVIIGPHPYSQIT